MSATASKVREVLAFLRRRGSKRGRDGMARYAIVAAKVYGVSVPEMRACAKPFGTDHDLAAALWATGAHEARLIASFVEDPALVTPAQMERWARGFDNWAVCDGVCVDLFDKTPHAWRKIRAWSRRREEFVKRAAFATLVGLAVHDKRAPDAPFLGALALIERASGDERNFVKKGVNWALRAIGKRNRALHRAAIALSRRLARSPLSSARWIGKDALRELTSAPVRRRLARAAR